MLVHGFTYTTLNKLVQDGLATVQPRTARTEVRRVTTIWVMITDVGLRALADR
jgi:hypothetical protein